MNASLYDMYDSDEEVNEVERLMGLDASELVTMINEEFGSELSVEHEIYEDIFYINDITYNYRYEYDYDGFLAMVEDMLYDLDSDTVAELAEKYC